MSGPQGGERRSGWSAYAAWALYALHTTLTVLAATWRPARSLPVSSTLATVLGATSAITGSALYADGFFRFRSLRQISGLEKGRLVTSGSYRFSRNPQIVGWGLVLLGISLARRSPRALWLVAAFFLIHQLYLPIEERHLERTFGEEYRRLRRDVPRYLGLPRQDQER